MPLAPEVVGVRLRDEACFLSKDMLKIIKGVSWWIPSNEYQAGIDFP